MGRPGEGDQKDEAAPGMSFEAAWSDAGAVCVRRPRLKDGVTPEALEALCPRLAGRIGASCSEEGASHDPATLILNKS